jgi:hypothetical protein
MPPIRREPLNELLKDYKKPGDLLSEDDNYSKQVSFNLANTSLRQ